MPIIVEETWDSRKIVIDNKTISDTLQFIIVGTMDEGDALIALKVVRPIIYRGLSVLSTNIDPLSGGVWKGTIVYGIPEGPPKPDNAQDPKNSDPLDPGISFSITGQTQHVTQSLETISKTSLLNPFDIPKDFKGTVGVTETNEVTGTDIYIPYMEVPITRLFSDMTWGYIWNAYAMVGKTNSQVWYGFQPDEALFLGAEIVPRQPSGSDNSGSGWSVTCKIAVSANRGNVVLGQGLTPIPYKGGWHYLWVNYGVVFDSVTQRMIQRPKTAYVERMYEREDFRSILGI